VRVCVCAFMCVRLSVCAFICACVYNHHSALCMRLRIVNEGKITLETNVRY